MTKTKVILIASLKGGVGKSTCVAALGDVLARRMKKHVLLIDGDPQGSLSRRFGYDPLERSETGLDVYFENEYARKKDRSREKVPADFFINQAVWYKPQTDIAARYENLHIMCANYNLENVYRTYQSDPLGSASVVRRLLFGLKDSGEFDFIIIDTQPALTYMLGQYMRGSDFVVVPVTPSEDAVLGAENIINAYNEAADEKQDYAKYTSLEMLGILFNRTCNRTKAAKEYVDNRQKFWDDDLLFNITIPQSQSVVNAENIGAPVTAAYPNSPASWQFRKLAAEMLDKIQLLKSEVDE